MSEETTTTTTTTPAETKTAKVVVPPQLQFNTKRNEVEYPIMQYVKTRGENEGNPYLRPAEVTKDNFDLFRTWIGDDMLLSIINAKMALMGSNITEQATDEKTKILSIELAQKYFEEFSTRGETKADLEDKREDVLKRMVEASRDQNLDQGARVALIMKLGDEANALQIAIDSKVRERKPKAAATTTATEPTVVQQ